MSPTTRAGKKFPKVCLQKFGGCSERKEHLCDDTQHSDGGGNKQTEETGNATERRRDEVGLVGGCGGKVWGTDEEREKKKVRRFEFRSTLWPFDDDETSEELKS